MTSLILGILGVLAGLGTVTFVLALVLGVIGTVFGFVGRARAGRREATNPTQATTGLALSILALVLAIVMPLWALHSLGDTIRNQFDRTSVGGSSGELQQQYLDCIAKIDTSDPDYVSKMAACATP
jgi:membrane-bound ClpP family serine protease